MDWLGLTTATAPWFFVAFLSGLLGITGVVVGGVVTFKSTKSSDIRRNNFEMQKIQSEQERADRQRWDRDLAQKAATFAQACYTLSMACERRIEEVKSGEAGNGGKKKRQVVEPWVEAGGAAVHALSDLLFIAPTSVGREAADWHADAVVLLNVANHQDREHVFWKEGLKEYWRTYRAHRRKLIDVVRGNLVSTSLGGGEELMSGWKPQAFQAVGQPGPFGFGQSGYPPVPGPFAYASGPPGYGGQYPVSSTPPVYRPLEEPPTDPRGFPRVGPSDTGLESSPRGQGP